MATERHHLDGDPTNNAPENVAQLASGAHTMAHRSAHCKHAHLCDQENSVTSRQAGHWQCRACLRERQLRYPPHRSERQRQRKLTNRSNLTW